MIELNKINKINKINGKVLHLEKPTNDKYVVCPAVCGCAGKRNLLLQLLELQRVAARSSTSLFLQQSKFLFELICFGEEGLCCCCLLQQQQQLQRRCGGELELQLTAEARDSRSAAGACRASSFAFCSLKAARDCCCCSSSSNE